MQPAQCLLTAIQCAERFVERQAYIVLIAVLCVFSARAWVESSGKPLWFDEALGLAVATVPDVWQIPDALALPVDINPPIYHLLARTSIELVGFSALSARLPSYIGVLVFAICLFAFVSRRYKRSYGVLAAAIMLCTPTAAYAWEARPYGVVLALTGIAMVAYQKRLESRSLSTLAVLLVTLGCLPMTHYYAVLVVAGVVFADTVRAFAQKRPDWPLLLGAALAVGGPLLLFSDVIGQQKAAMAHSHFAPTLTSFIGAYESLQIPEWLTVLALAATALLLFLARSAPTSQGDTSYDEFSIAEMALAASLLILPVVGLVVAMVGTNVYIPRYFLSATGGYAVLYCNLARAVQRSQGGGLAVVLSALAMLSLGYELVRALRQAHDPPPLAAVIDRTVDAGSPILFEDAKDFILARELAPERSKRFFYAAEPELALKMTGSDSDDKLMRSLAKIQSVQVMRIHDLYAINERWIVVPGAWGWLTECLAAMELYAERVHSASRDVLATTLPDPDTMLTPWCESR